MHSLFFSMPLLTMLAIMWAVFILDSMSRGALSTAFRLHPRSPFGLIGIVTSPFLHGSMAHIMGNSGAFVVLGMLIAIQGWSMFVFVTVAITLIYGFLLWLLSPNPVVGASGLIFGYLGYLIAYGMTVDDGLPWVAGLIGLVLYGSAWTGIFPSGRTISGQKISWLAHAIGFAVGLAVGHYLGMRAINLGVYGG